MTNFEGKFYLPTDAGFEEAAMGRIFNGRRPDRRPDAVLYAESDQDLINAVKLAKEKDWQIAIRSGGHSWAAWSVREGSLLIDLSKLQEVSYDEATGIAKARPAVQGGMVLDPWLAERGRFFNGGHCPPVGIGGFLLQGGQGWCARGWGWAAESVVAVDVLTAEGEIVRADATQNQDLYYAARGAGPSFPGIVTNFYLQTRPRFKHVGHTVQLFDIEHFEEIMRWMYSSSSLCGWRMRMAPSFPARRCTTDSSTRCSLMKPLACNSSSAWLNSCGSGSCRASFCSSSVRVCSRIASRRRARPLIEGPLRWGSGSFTLLPNRRRWATG